MKSLQYFALFTLSFVTLVSCKNEQTPEVKVVETSATEEIAQLDPNATYAKAEFTIEGMTCAMGCAKTIEKKIAGMDGVQSATVDFDKKLAMVVYNEAKVSTSSIEETVTKVGESYTVKDMKTVESFSTEKTCSPDCKKACCASKTEAEKKMACAKDCKKACCASKA